LVPLLSMSHKRIITPNIIINMSENGELLTIIKEDKEIQLTVYEFRALVIGINNLYKETFGLTL
jgi:hypothetical protein